MGLMDKVKAQASELASQGKAKYGEVQATRRANVLLRNLGAVVYADRTGRGSGDTEAQIEKLITEIKAHESANGINLSAVSTDHPDGTAGSAGPAGTAGSAGPAGTAGSAGPAGTAGSTGPAGTAGSAGSTGFPPEADSTTQV
jgi:hypothetical protein